MWRKQLPRVKKSNKDLYKRTFINDRLEIHTARQLCEFCGAHLKLQGELNGIKTVL